MTKEPKKIKLSDFVSNQKEPIRFPLKSIYNDENDELIITVDGARILLKKENENHTKDNS